MDETIIAHENRITKLEMVNEINWPQILARLKKLEEFGEQVLRSYQATERPGSERLT